MEKRYGGGIWGEGSIGAAGHLAACGSFELEPRQHVSPPRTRWCIPPPPLDSCAARRALVSITCYKWLKRRDGGEQERIHTPLHSLPDQPHPGVPLLFAGRVHLVHLGAGSRRTDQEHPLLLVGHLSHDQLLQGDDRRLLVLCVRRFCII